MKKEYNCIIFLLFFFLSFSLYSMDFNENNENKHSKIYKELRRESTTPIVLIFTGGILVSWGALLMRDILRGPQNCSIMISEKKINIFIAGGISLSGLIMFFWQVKQLDRLHAEYLGLAKRR